MPPGSPPGWAYFHLTRGANFNAVGMADTNFLAVQHCAWTDGSVEWINAGSLDVRLESRDQNASYRTEASGSYITWYWF
jgi:hypothetical protein